MSRRSFSGLLDSLPPTIRQRPPSAAFRDHPEMQPTSTRIRRKEDLLLAPDDDSAERAKVLRVVIVSDTHSGHSEIPPESIPPADVLIHAGDFTDVGHPRDVDSFCTWLDSLKHVAHKIVIAGNHDISLDAPFYQRSWRRFGHPKPFDTAALVGRLKESCIYLDHECVSIDGVTFFGSPYQPEFCDWAFNLGRENFECYDKWASIPAIVERYATLTGCPNRIDVLITHGPPLFMLDRCAPRMEHQGCLDLLDFAMAARPYLHAFGHIHEDFGVVRHQETGTLFANASMMDLQYNMCTPLPECSSLGSQRRLPIVVDVPKQR